MKPMYQIFIVLTALAFVTTGCQTTGQGSKTYTRSQTQAPMQVYTGTVLKIADVEIQRDRTGVGAAGGGVTGGVLGSTIGSGRGKKIATTAGAVAGAAAGTAIEQQMGTKAAFEIEVELDDGRILVIVQEKDDEYAVGDRVRVIEGRDGSFRVRQ